MKRKVVFLCATNGVQSPMAEALLNRIAPEHFESFSAGSEPTSACTHPLTTKVMEEIGMDLRQKVPKSVADIQNQSFDFLITIGDRTQFNVPGVSASEVIHWEFEDPTKYSDLNKQLRAFRMARDQISQRLHLFVLVQVRSKGAATAAPSKRSQAALAH
jgi:protein-tyrosine-phosphatase